MLKHSSAPNSRVAWVQAISGKTHVKKSSLAQTLILLGIQFHPNPVPFQCNPNSLLYTVYTQWTLIQGFSRHILVKYPFSSRFQMKSVCFVNFTCHGLAGQQLANLCCAGVESKTILTWPCPRGSWHLQATSQDKSVCVPLHAVFTSVSEHSWSWAHRPLSGQASLTSDLVGQGKGVIHWASFRPGTFSCLDHSA